LQNNDNRWYNAIIGRWLSQDPLGLGPDTNPYRYCGNGPANGSDPSGLVQKVVIWINPQNMPSDFNVKAVEAQINSTLEAAGVSARVILLQTTRPKSPDFQGWCGEGSKKEWQNYVEFDPVATGYSAWSSGYGFTYICTTFVHAQPGFDPAKVTMLYSNILIHEVFWLGVLGHWVDSFFAAKNQLGSAQYSDTDPRDISSDEAHKIDDALFPYSGPTIPQQTGQPFGGGVGVM
jgi:hypothetical protein